MTNLNIVCFVIEFKFFPFVVEILSFPPPSGVHCGSHITFFCYNINHSSCRTRKVVYSHKKSAWSDIDRYILKIGFWFTEWTVILLDFKVKLSTTNLILDISIHVRSSRFFARVYYSMDPTK